MTAVIDRNRCTGCSLCLEICPDHALSIVGGAAFVDGQRCTGCGACLAPCQKGAVSFVRPAAAPPRGTAE